MKGISGEKHWIPDRLFLNMDFKEVVRTTEFRVRSEQSQQTGTLSKVRKTADGSNRELWLGQDVVCADAGD